jgi:hypothetical protein
MQEVIVFAFAPAPALAKPVAAALCALLMAGCADFRPPEYKRPETPAKADWSRTESISVSPAETIVPNWWQGFGDPYLDELVAKALAGNYDIRVLAARIRVASAQIGEARAGALPVFDIGAGASFDKTTGQAMTRTFNLGATVNWDIDIWGKVEKGVQAQTAEYRASEADWRAGYLALVSDVSITYFTLLQLDEQIAQQRLTVSRNNDILTTYKAMLANGLLPQIRVMQQQAEINRLNKDLIELRRSRDVAENALGPPATSRCRPADCRIGSSCPSCRPGCRRSCWHAARTSSPPSTACCPRTTSSARPGSPSCPASASRRAAARPVSRCPTCSSPSLSASCRASTCRCSTPTCAPA